MARPVRKRLVRGDLTGLRQRIRSRSCCSGQDGDPRVLVLIKVSASMRHLLNQGSRAPVQPSGHLTYTTHRPQRPPVQKTCSAADLVYAAADWPPIVLL